MGQKDTSKEIMDVKNPAEETGEDPLERTVRWDDSNMDSTYANVGNIFRH